MKNLKLWISMLPVYILILGGLLVLAINGSNAISVYSQSLPVPDRNTVIIDAGHGGIDGGAVSCTGIYESKINLEIALRLDDLFHLIGIQTKMIRTTDRSVYTTGESIAQKKISDLRNRVQTVNSTDNAILVSIHQNNFTDSRYSGAQVFYAESEESEQLAKKLQDLIGITSPNANNRQIKPARNVYLMNHISCPGILIECGFLSNPEEEAKLRSSEYQKNLCCIIASTVSNHLDRAETD